MNILWFKCMVLLAIVQANTLNDIIYTPINFDNVLCIRMNNYNSQIGCQTNRDGDNGILYPFYTENDLEILHEIEMNIIAVINASMFTNNTLQHLIKSPKTKGLIIIEDNLHDTFSPEKSCPGNGFNFGENRLNVKEEACINQHLWNPSGNWMSYYDIPFGVFIIRNETEKIVLLTNSQLNRVDNTLDDYPLWGGEMKAFMNAASDTSTCIRRGTCDPIAGINIFVNFVPRLEKRKKIILFTVKADATAFFKSMSYGGAASAISMVTMFGVIKALSHTRDSDKDNDFNSILNAEIMVSFLQGESFDYTGSQRLAYDLKTKQFGNFAYNISLDDIKLVIEIGPIGVSNEIYIHSPKKTVDVEMIKSLFSSYNKAGSESRFVNSTDIPPSSYNSFLREDENVSGIIITDTGSELISSYFGSRYDILDTTPLLTKRIKSIIETITNVTLEFAGGKASVYTSVEESFVSNLLDCYLVNQNCSLLRQVLNQTDLKDERLSRYSSVGSHTSNATIYINRLVSIFSHKLLNQPAEKCNETFSDGWDVLLINGSCYGTVINGSSAKSPAFVVHDYNSTKYSTWTESRWSPEFKLRIFKVASNTESITIFSCGLLYFIIVSLFIVQCYRKRTVMF